MGLLAAGAYLEELRRIRNMTRQELARALGISHDSLADTERGRTRMNGPALFRWIGLLDGSYEQVAALLEMEENEDSAEDARALAQLWAIRPAVIGDRPLTAEEEKAELWEIALRRADGDRNRARRLLLRALDELLGE